MMVVIQRVCQNRHMCPHQMKHLECCLQSQNFGDQGVNWVEMVIVFGVWWIGGGSSKFIGGLGTGIKGDGD